MSISVTSVRNLVLFTGGYTDDINSVERVDHIDIYNTLSNQWSVAHLSQLHSGMAATMVGDMAIFAGGYNDKLGGPQAMVDAYNVSSGWWFTAGLHLLEAWSSLSAMSVGGFTLFAGGFSTVVYAVPMLDIFNVSTSLVLPSTMPSATPSVSPTASITPSIMLSVSPSSSSWPSCCQVPAGGKQSVACLPLAPGENFPCHLVHCEISPTKLIDVCDCSDVVALK
jgi:hypothetical protein